MGGFHAHSSGHGSDANVATSITGLKQHAQSLVARLEELEKSFLEIPNVPEPVRKGWWSRFFGKKDEAPPK